jgi:hypothetical protein
VWVYTLTHILAQNFLGEKVQKKQLISKEISCFMVAGGGLEPPTSGL